MFKDTVLLYFENVFYDKPYFRDVAILLKFRNEDEGKCCTYVVVFIGAILTFKAIFTPLEYIPSIPLL